MTQTLNVEPYLERIGYGGPREATHEVLAEITRRHALTFTFENLDVLSGLPIVLDVASIEDKLVHRRRGGYCWEQNLLAAGVLRELGFEVAVLGARPRWMLPPETIMARTHVLLLVTARGERRLVDPGFGALSLTAPLRLDFEGEQPTMFEPQRVVPAGGGKLLQAKLKGEWRDLYSFTEDALEPADWELASWFASTHPSSKFTQNLIVARAAAGARRVLVNRELSTYRGGEVQRARVDDPDELLEVLRTQFELSFPPGTRFGEPGVPWAR